MLKEEVMSNFMRQFPIMKKLSHYSMQISSKRRSVIAYVVTEDVSKSYCGQYLCKVKMAKCTVSQSGGLIM